MQHQEQKYLVESFDDVITELQKAEAVAALPKTSTHYYAQQPGNDVVKLVIKENTCEIHELKESNGNFKLVNNIPVPDRSTGLMWLKKHDFSNVSIVAMKHTDYRYKNGIVGLYVINDTLNSIILDFPEGQHNAIAEELGIMTNNLIQQPYNKYLEAQSILPTMAIDSLLV